MKKILTNAFLAITFFASNAQEINIVEYDLDNGLHIILHQDNSAPVVSTVLQYHVGSKDEYTGIKGFAHLFEHMLGKETKNMKSGEWYKIYRSRGGNGNASTSVDLTSYYVTLPSNSLELALWRYSEIMLHPVIDQETIDVQREAVKEEKRQRDNQPYGRFYQYLKENFFEVHPYKFPIIGFIEDLDSSSLEDFKDFKEKFYSPSNAVFVIAGDIDIDQTKKLVSYYFDEVPDKGEKPIKLYPKEKPFEQKRVQEFDPNIQIPALFYAFRTPSATERDSSVLNYISTYLSGGESSVLYKKLVDEKEMALAVQAINIDQEDYSMFAILILPQGETSFEDLINEVEVEISKIQKEMISENDYQKIQNNLENIYVSSLGSVSGISQSLARYHNIYEDASMINKISDIVRSVSIEEIQAVANKYLNKDQRLIMEYLPETNE
jgi:predicted Zn-dependent peptidase